MRFEDLVDEERDRQDRKWGEQNHEPYFWLAILVEEAGELARAMLENIKWGHNHAEGIEEELIQVAAVAKAIWESGKRNSWL